MALNAVSFDILCNQNFLMRSSKRTWVRISRHAECKNLRTYYQRNIGKSWLDDNRGWLKRNHFLRVWHTGIRADNGHYEGSTSSKQFTKKACYALQKRGIIVYSPVWHAVTGPRKGPDPGTPQPGDEISTQVQPPRKPGENPFEDPEFRDKHGLTPRPPGKPS